MSNFYAGADTLRNLSRNIIPTSITVTPWQCKLAQKIFTLTGDRKMKSMAGPQGWNTWIIDQMFKYYQQTPTVDFVKQKTRVSSEVANAFANNINTYKGRDAREGLAAKAIDLVSDVAEGAGDLAKNAPFTIPTVLIIVACGVAGYLIFAGKKGVRLVP